MGDNLKEEGFLTRETLSLWIGMGEEPFKISWIGSRSGFQGGGSIIDGEDPGKPWQGGELEELKGDLKEGVFYPWRIKVEFGLVISMRVGLTFGRHYLSWVWEEG